MNVNVWDVTDPIQALVRSGREVPAERLTRSRRPAGGAGRLIRDTASGPARVPFARRGQAWG